MSQKPFYVFFSKLSHLHLFQCPVPLLVIEIHVISSLQWRAQHCSQGVGGLLPLGDHQETLIIPQQGEKKLAECGARLWLWIPIKQYVLYNVSKV